MNVLLISILPNEHRNLSCLTLFAVAAEAGYKVELLFIPHQKEYAENRLESFLREHSIDVVGMSVTTDGFNFASELTRWIKSCLPRVQVIWGGIHPTCLPEESLGVVDVICRGEGERFFVEYLECLCHKREVRTLSGLGYKSSDGGIVLNELSPLVENLDQLPIVKYDWQHFFILTVHGVRPFVLDDYVALSRHKGDGYTVMASRSCPHNCAYCINSYLNDLYQSRGRVRRRSVDHVLRELKVAIETIPTVRFINFIDDHFLTSKQWIAEFCEKYSRDIHLPFMIRASPETITDENIEPLMRAGLVALQTGIQSGSEKTHKMIFHRSFKRDMLVKASTVLKKHGIKAIYDVIIDNEFEDDGDRDQTLKLLLDLQRPYECNIFVLTPFPKTTILDLYKERGLKPKVDPYVGGYLDYDEKNYYYQMASVIPYIPRLLGQYLFRYRDGIPRYVLGLVYRKVRSRLRNLS